MSEKNSVDNLRPVASTERIQALDVLRGIAILAVLVAYAAWSLGTPPFETYAPVDRTLEFILSTFVDTKAYTLLAFLFGVGFAIQMQRAEQRGESVVPVYCRRLLALVAIGIVHALVLRNGDILVPYATLGFVMLLFRNASNATIIVAIVVGAFIQYAARYAWELSGIPFPARPDTTGLDNLTSNLLWTKYWYTTAITFWPGALPMLLAGFYVGRKRFFEHVAERTGTLRRVAIAGLCCGGLFFGLRLIVASALGPNAGPTFTAAALGLLWSAHAWGMAAFYASTIMLLMQRPAFNRILSPFAALGRMSLTNYLLQSIILVPVCIVFGLFDTIKPGFALLLSLIVALVQLPFSILWLRYFRFGPAEWLWRSITYWKPQPMRRAHADANSPATVRSTDRTRSDVRPA